MKFKVPSYRSVACVLSPYPHQAPYVCSMPLFWHLPLFSYFHPQNDKRAKVVKHRQSGKRPSTVTHSQPPFGYKETTTCKIFAQNPYGVIDKTIAGQEIAVKSEIMCGKNEE